MSHKGEGTCIEQQGLLITSELASGTEEGSKQYGESNITTLTNWFGYAMDIESVKHSHAPKKYWAK